MTRKQRAIHLISLIAIVVGLFSPLLSLPVTAEDEPPVPDVSVSTGDEEPAPADQNPEDGEPGDEVGDVPAEGDPAPDVDTPEAPVLIPVVPLPPVITEAVCGEGDVFAQVATAPTVEGVTYDIGAPDPDGAFIVTVTLTDPAVYTWADTGMDGWTVSDSHAEMTGSVALCPVEDGSAGDSEPGVTGEVDTDEVDSEQSGIASNSMATASANNVLGYSISPPTPVGSGSIVKFTTSVYAPEQSHWVGMSNTLPAGVTVTSITVLVADSDDILHPVDPNAYICAEAEGVVNCAFTPLWTLLSGSTVYWTVNTTVDMPAEGETCVGGARSSFVTGNWPESPTLIGDMVVDCPGLTLSATDNLAEGGSIGLYEPFTYKVTVTNPGIRTIPIYAFASQLPSGVVLTGDSPISHPEGSTCGNDGIAITCSGTVVLPGAANALVFEFTVMAVDMVGDQINTAACDTAMLVASAIFGEWDPRASLVNVYTNVVCTTGVEYSLEPLEATVQSGGKIGFVQTVHNTGNTHITGIGIFSTLPPDLPGDAEWSGYIELDGVRYATVPPIHGLKPGSVFKVFLESEPVPADVTLPAPEWCTEFTYATPAEFRFSTGLVVNDFDSASVQVHCPSLKIEQTVSPGLVEPGGSVEYTIVVENEGNATVSPLMVFHDSTDTSGVFSNWRVSSVGELDCGLVNDSDPGCTYLLLDPQESVTITVIGEAPVDPTAEQCEPVSSRAVFVYGETLTPSVATAGISAPYTPQYSEPVTTQLACNASFTLTNEPLDWTVEPGETIGFRFIAHNNGTVPITDLSLNLNDLPDLPEGDWNISAELDDTPVNLESLGSIGAGETLVVTVESIAVPVDLTVPENEWCTPWSANVTATAAFSSAPEQSISESATIDVLCTGLGIDLSVNLAVIAPNGQVQYTATVTNRGNTAVQPLIVGVELGEPSSSFSNWAISSDAENEVECSQIPDENEIALGCSIQRLESGSSVTIVVTGDAPDLPTLAQCGEIEAQAVFLYGAATIYPLVSVLQRTSVPLSPPGVPIFSNVVSTQIDCQPEVDITLESEVDSDDGDRSDVGDSIAYTLVVTNSGNMTLYDGVVTSDLAGIEWDRDLVIDELQPGESLTFTGTYAVDQNDIDAGQVEVTVTVNAALEPASNVAIVQFVGLAQSTAPLPVVPDSVTNSVTEITVLNQQPAILLTVTGETDSASADTVSPGDTITYTYLVTNSGNVELTNAEIVTSLDDLIFGDGHTIATLAPGEEATLTASYVVLDDDVENGAVEMCAEVSATTPGNGTAAAESECVIFEVALSATPVPDVPPTAEAVTGLPETGHGSATVRPMLFAAAFLSIVALGVGSIGIRRRTQ